MKGFTKRSKAEEKATGVTRSGNIGKVVAILLLAVMAVSAVAYGVSMVVAGRALDKIEAGPSNGTAPDRPDAAGYTPDSTDHGAPPAKPAEEIFEETSKDMDMAQTDEAPGEGDEAALRHLRIEYMSEDGRALYRSYSASVPIGGSYAVKSPTIWGLTPNVEEVSGIMGNVDTVYTVTYSPGKDPTTVEHAPVGGGVNLDDDGPGMTPQPWLDTIITMVSLG